MKQRGAVISGLLAIAAAAGLASVFVSNASPYLSISEARIAKGTNIHVSGALLKASLRQDLARREATFVIEDQGQSLEVIYRGKPQPNLVTATKVVVIGSMDNGRFIAQDMLLKCPSKYESEQGASGTLPN